MNLLFINLMKYSFINIMLKADIIYVHENISEKAIFNFIYLLLVLGLIALAIYLVYTLIRLNKALDIFFKERNK